MKKTRFFLMALLLVAVLMFTGCGNRAAENNQVADERGNIQRNVNDGKNSLGEDVRNDMRDAADDVRNGVDNVENDINHNVNDRNNIAAEDTTRTVK